MQSNAEMKVVVIWRGKKEKKCLSNWLQEIFPIVLKHNYCNCTGPTFQLRSRQVQCVARGWEFGYDKGRSNGSIQLLRKLRISELVKHATCKGTQHCRPTTPNIVGCYMLRLFALPVTSCCVLLGVVAQSLKPVKLLAMCKRTQQLGQQCCDCLHEAKE